MRVESRRSAPIARDPELGKRGEHGVTRDPAFRRQQLSHERVPPGRTPGQEQRGHAEQRHIPVDAEQAGHVQDRHAAQGGEPQQRVPPGHLRTVAPAHQLAEQQDTQSPGQPVRGQRHGDPQSTLTRRRELNGEPADRHGAHPVPERRGRDTREHALHGRIGDHRPVRRFIQVHAATPCQSNRPL
jgi:hypothetical protein